MKTKSVKIVVFGNDTVEKQSFYWSYFFGKYVYKKNMAWHHEFYKKSVNPFLSFEVHCISEHQSIVKNQLMSSEKNYKKKVTNEFFGANFILFYFDPKDPNVAKLKLDAYREKNLIPHDAKFYLVAVAQGKKNEYKEEYVRSVLNEKDTPMFFTCPSKDIKSVMRVFEAIEQDLLPEINLNNLRTVYDALTAYQDFHKKPEKPKLNILEKIKRFFFKEPVSEQPKENRSHGIRGITRFNYFYHGDSGVVRVERLIKELDVFFRQQGTKSLEEQKSFCDKFKINLIKACQSSSNTHHSLNNYLNHAFMLSPYNLKESISEAAKEKQSVPTFKFR